MYKTNLMYSEEFTQLWSVYPKKIAKWEASQVFRRMRDHLGNGFPAEVHKALEWQRKSRKWNENGGEFVPLFKTYLRQHRWKDDPLECADKPLIPPIPGHDDPIGRGLWKRTYGKQ